MSEEECYVALRFADDGNLSERLYWYECPFPIREGERALAPVGVHDRLQCGIVERVRRGGEPPYDVRLLKRAATKLYSRRLPLSVPCRELGGVKYDEKHYTRFGAFVCAASFPSPSDRQILKDYGVTGEILFREEAFGGDAGQFLTSEEIRRAMRQAARTKGCVLIAGGLPAQIFSAYLLLLAGVSEAAAAEDFFRGEREEYRERRAALSEFFRGEGGAAGLAATIGRSREAEEIAQKLRG